MDKDNCLSVEREGVEKEEIFIPSELWREILFFLVSKIEDFRKVCFVNKRVNEILKSMEVKFYFSNYLGKVYFKGIEVGEITESGLKEICEYQEEGANFNVADYLRKILGFLKGEIKLSKEEIIQIKNSFSRELVKCLNNMEFLEINSKAPKIIYKILPFLRSVKKITIKEAFIPKTFVVSENVEEVNIFRCGNLRRLVVRGMGNKDIRVNYCKNLERVETFNSVYNVYNVGGAGRVYMADCGGEKGEGGVKVTIILDSEKKRVKEERVCPEVGGCGIL